MVPVGDGQTELIVEIGSLQQRVPVAVGGSHVDRPVAFESEVLVALSKQGCNSGLPRFTKRQRDVPIVAAGLRPQTG